MTLPYDTKRCTGHEVKEPFGWTLHPDCIGCQRRTAPPKGDEKAAMRVVITGENCEQRIEGEKK